MRRSSCSPPSRWRRAPRASRRPPPAFPRLNTPPARADGSVVRRDLLADRPRRLADRLGAPGPRSATGSEGVVLGAGNGAVTTAPLRQSSARAADRARPLADASKVSNVSNVSKFRNVSSSAPSAAWITESSSCSLSTSCAASPSKRSSIRDDETSPSDACASRSRSSSRSSESSFSEKSSLSSRRAASEADAAAALAEEPPRAPPPRRSPPTSGTPALKTRRTRSDRRASTRAPDRFRAKTRAFARAVFKIVFKTVARVAERVSECPPPRRDAHPPAARTPIEATLVSTHTHTAACTHTHTATGTPRPRRSERICAPSQRRGRPTPPRAAALREVFILVDRGIDGFVGAAVSVAARLTFLFFAARVRRARDAHPRDDSLLRGRGVRLAKRRGSRAPGPESARQRARHAREQTETARFRVRSVGFATLHAVVRVSGDFLPARRRARRRHGARGLAPLLEHLLLPRGGDDLPLQLAHLGEAHRGHDVRAGDHRRDERRA